VWRRSRKRQARALSFLSWGLAPPVVGGGLTTATVKVRHPEVTHVVKIQDFENWLNKGCTSPAETALKTRVRQMLGQHHP
jgi:hypothetical protein